MPHGGNSLTVLLEEAQLVLPSSTRELKNNSSSKSTQESDLNTISQPDLRSTEHLDV